MHIVLFGADFFSLNFESTLEISLNGNIDKWRVYFQNQTNPLWYFWEKQVSLTEFIHMSMGKQNLD